MAAAALGVGELTAAIAATETVSKTAQHALAQAGKTGDAFSQALSRAWDAELRKSAAASAGASIASENAQQLAVAQAAKGEAAVVLALALARARKAGAIAKQAEGREAVAAAHTAEAMAVANAATEASQTVRSVSADTEVAQHEAMGRARERARALELLDRHAQVIAAHVAAVATAHAKDRSRSRSETEFARLESIPALNTSTEHISAPVDPIVADHPVVATPLGKGWGHVLLTFSSQK